VRRPLDEGRVPVLFDGRVGLDSRPPVRGNADHGGIRHLPRVALSVNVAHDCLHGHDLDLRAVLAMFYRSDVCDYTIAIQGLRLSPCCQRVCSCSLWAGSCNLIGGSGSAPDFMTCGACAVVCSGTVAGIVTCCWRVTTTVIKVTCRRMFYDRSYVDKCQSSNIISVRNKTATLNFMTLVVTTHCLVGQLHTLCPK
jgi:hypothetical protein